VFETAEDLVALQRLLDESWERGGAHLRSIITPERRMTAEEVVELLEGMTLISLATVTRDGRPLVGPVDGFFYRGEYWFSSSPTSLRFRHIRERPHVSATHLPSEAYQVTVHGRASIEGTPAEIPEQLRAFLSDFYGDWFDDYSSEGLYARIEADRMHTFHLDPEDAAAEMEKLKESLKQDNA
jgi:general stress protein 26